LCSRYRCILEGDYDELGHAAPRSQEGRQAFCVEHIQVCVDLVHYVEWHWMDLLECEEVADCRDGFLSPTRASDGELGLSGELKQDIESAFERVFRIVQDHSSVSLTCHLAKNALECLVDLVVSAHEGVKLLPLQFVHEVENR